MVSQVVRHGRRGGLCDKVRASAQSLVEGDGAGLRELLPPERQSDARLRAPWRR